MTPAVFLDRDGTIIEHVHHLTDVNDVRLIAGAAEAISRLTGAGYRCVVVTNQSVLGRGLLSVEGLEAVHAEMCRQLAASGAYIDAIYYCPEVPRGNDLTQIEHSHRKPGPGMLLQAALELKLDLSRSWMVGDSISDVLAGVHAGCRASILIGGGRDRGIEVGQPAVTHIADDLSAAAKHILSVGR